MLPALRAVRSAKGRGWGYLIHWPAVECWAGNLCLGTGQPVVVSELGSWVVLVG